MYRHIVRSFSTNTNSALAVVGSGQMGLGIALVNAMVHKQKTLMLDVNQTQIDKSMKFAASLLSKDVAKGVLQQQDMNDILARIVTATDYNAIKDHPINFVVEAATENIDLKRKIFNQLSDVTSKDCILATNTSSISITKIASATSRPEKVIGMHFMNPVPKMKLVEIITGLQTSKETLDITLQLAKDMGKVTSQSKDMPGFIANRVLMPYINEAVYVLQDGIATREDIDTTMKLGTNVPMGPLTLADFIGLDTCLAIMKVLHDGLGDSKYRPAPLLQSYVDAGWLGKKSGRGFYEYK